MRLEVTRKSDLAIRSLATLAGAVDRMKTAEMAERLDAAPAFMAQVLGELVGLGWVDSSPGPTGGYRIVVDTETLSVIDVIEGLEGPTDNNRCVVADSSCGSGGDHCALHVAWTAARAALIAQLGELSVAAVGMGGGHPAPSTDSNGPQAQGVRP